MTTQYGSFVGDPIDFYVDVVFDAASPVQTMLGGAFSVQASTNSPPNTASVTGTATYVNPTRLRVQFPGNALIAAVWKMKVLATPNGYNQQRVANVFWTVSP